MPLLKKTTPCPMNALGKTKGPNQACKDDTNQHDHYTDTQPAAQTSGQRSAQRKVLHPAQPLALYPAQPVLQHIDRSTPQPVAQSYSCSQRGGCQPDGKIRYPSEPGNLTPLPAIHADFPSRSAWHATQELLEDPEAESISYTK